MDKVFDGERRKIARQKDKCSRFVDKLRDLVENPIGHGKSLFRFSEIYQSAVYLDQCPNIKEYVDEHNKNNENIKFNIDSSCMNHVSVSVDPDKKTILYTLDCPYTGP